MKVFTLPGSAATNKFGQTLPFNLIMLEYAFGNGFLCHETLESLNYDDLKKLAQLYKPCRKPFAMHLPKHCGRTIKRSKKEKRQTRI